MAANRKNRPFTVYPPAELRNAIERIALEWDRPASYVAAKLMKNAIRRLEKRKQLTPA